MRVNELKKYKAADPSAYSSFQEFMLGAAGVREDITSRPQYLGVFDGRLAFGPNAKAMTLRMLAVRLDLTRERIRQIEKNLRQMLFADGKLRCYVAFERAILKMFRHAGWIIPGDSLVTKVNRHFKWQATSLDNIVSSMTCFGHMIENVGDNLYVCDFERELTVRYNLFLQHVNTYDGVLLGYSFEYIAEHVPGLADFKKREYEVFVRKGMFRKVVKGENGEWAPLHGDIRPLRARQYYAHCFHLSVGTTRGGYNRSTLRKDAMLAVLKEAGPGGLTVREILSRCKKRLPHVGWTLTTVKSVANIGNSLDRKGTRMIGFDRGSNRGTHTAFTLNTFFHDDKTREVLTRAAQEAETYMRTTGLGMISVWGIWEKYHRELPIDLPKLGFYMVMRDLKAGNLEYRDYPKISLPGVDVCENSYWWECYQYFRGCGRLIASSGDIMHFLSDALQIPRSVAATCIFQTMKMRRHHRKGVLYCTLLRPPKPENEPRMLLDNIKLDPKMSLLAECRLNAKRRREEVLEAAQKRNLEQ